MSAACDWSVLRTQRLDQGCQLVHLIREQLKLTGTHVGCDTAQCGACTVHLNGRAVKACSILAVQAEGAEITTIEGLAPEGTLHPMQEAFRECHALQCGFCQSGMMLSARALLDAVPDVVFRYRLAEPPPDTAA